MVWQLGGILERLRNLFEPLSSSPGHHQSLQEGLAEAQLALDSRVDVLGLTQCSQDILVVKIPPQTSGLLMYFFFPLSYPTAAKSKSGCCIMLSELR